VNGRSCHQPGTEYRFSPPDAAYDIDYIDAPGDTPEQYREDAAAAASAGYDDTIYGRVVYGSDGRLWLQYWLFYLANTKQYATAGVHEGDWEFVQIRLDDNHQPDAMTFAQHNSARACDWSDVTKSHLSTDYPMVHVAANSHASYPVAGATQYVGPPASFWDTHDGDGAWKVLVVDELDETDGWVTWPGRWGAGGSADSPRSPSQQGSKWTDPSQFHSNADQDEPC
jgi:hypothetical protein